MGLLRLLAVMLQVPRDPLRLQPAALMLWAAAALPVLVLVRTASTPCSSSGSSCVESLGPGPAPAPALHMAAAPQ
jgi:hypothetical protein